MKHLLVFFFIGFSSYVFAQANLNNAIIPFLCDNQKYGIADQTTWSHSDCLFDELSISNIGVALGEVDGEHVFVRKDGSYSAKIKEVTYTEDRKIEKFNELNASDRFFTIKVASQIYIYDAIFNKHHGPLKKAESSRNNLLSALGRYGLPPRSIVTYTKDDNHYILSSNGSSLELPKKEVSKIVCKGNYLYVVGITGIYSKIFNEYLEVEELLDTIVFVQQFNKNNWAIKNGKRYNILSNETLKLEEIPFSLKWKHMGFTYHENDGKKWIEDHRDSLFYTLSEEERVFPFYYNIASYKGNRKQLLIGADSLKIREPFLSIAQIGKNRSKLLFQDSLGYYIFDSNGDLLSSEAILKAHSVDNELLWVEYTNGRMEVLDKNLKVIAEPEVDIHRTFIGNTYIYKEDTLYGLADSLGKPISPPLSTQSDFYTTPNLEWIKIDQGKKAYIYNIYTKVRTEGLRNEFRFSERYMDEEGSFLISASTYGVDSAYLYRQDGSIYQTMGKSELRHFQNDKFRYTRKRILENDYIFIDLLHTDTLLTCQDCDDMYMVDLEWNNEVDFVVCRYRNVKLDLYDTNGVPLLPEGVSLPSKTHHETELKFYPQVIVQKGDKAGIYNIEKKEMILPFIFDGVSRLGDNHLALLKKGKRQITNLKGVPINDKFYYHVNQLGNGDFLAQVPIEGTYKKRVYFDRSDPNMDPCKGKIIDAPNYYFTVLDNNGDPRFDKRFVNYYYTSDDLINVEEQSGRDTIYYCMDIKGRNLKTTSKDVQYRPFHNDVFERREARQYMFVDSNLETLIDRKFDKINYYDFEERSFYYGVDSTHTYIYNDQFEPTVSILGKYNMSSYGDSMLKLVSSDYKSLYLLHVNGTLFDDFILTNVNYYNERGIVKFKKKDKVVYVDMVNKRKFWGS